MISKDGRFALYAGGCLEQLPKVPDASVGFVLTDPPFGTTDLPWDKAFGPEQWAEWWRQINRVCVAGANVVMFAAQPFATDLISTNRRRFRYDLVWEKSRAVGFLSANIRPLRAHELILLFKVAGAPSTYHPQKTPGKPYVKKAGAHSCKIYRQHSMTAAVNTGDRHPRSVLRFGSVIGGIHPTEKPADLMRWLVRTYSNRDDVVLDTFTGSAVTAEASIVEGRRFIGFEKDAEYFRRGQRRLQAINNQTK